MKKEGTIGLTALLAIAAVVGISLQPASKQVQSGQTAQKSMARRPESTPAKAKGPVKQPGCSGIEGELEGFLEIEALTLPEQCYEKGTAPPNVLSQDLAANTSRLKFVIAILPDPLHTHLPVLFDQFTAAIQEAAQDEKYDFDSSWLPWNDDEQTYSSLLDQETASLQKELRENQPGIILFRKASNCDQSKHPKAGSSKAGEPPDDCLNLSQESGPGKQSGNPLIKSYREGLVVFVVGEEATHGIHREQFRNALTWIEKLESRSNKQLKRVAILGPSFSGSLPSLAQVLSELNVTEQLDLHEAGDDDQLAIYSGSVTGKSSATAFQNALAAVDKTGHRRIVFHSFMRDDEEVLNRFCGYLWDERLKGDIQKVAILSEDETAYGSAGVGDHRENGQKGEIRANTAPACPFNGLELFYPRDISALRGAYQTGSLFNTGAASQSTDAQHRNLPTDLADPAGEVHDSIRSYGGNQTPLTQEAFLLEIVAALREFHTRYIILRSSNILDQLFLTNFLRRMYPDGRIVILNADLLFAREHGSTGLSGAMTLSSYPLFPLERDWTESRSLPAADRVFSSDTSEGTYIAFRLLLNSKGLNGETKNRDTCYVVPQSEGIIFVPPVVCVNDPIPDYSPPYWMLSAHCPGAKIGTDCPYPGPATWLSVIGANRFWPMASLTGQSSRDHQNASKVSFAEWTKLFCPKGTEGEPGRRPEMPPGMKVFLILLTVFSMFHAWCCWSGSYTAKPAFRAHFAGTGDRPHNFLVLTGCCSLSFMAIVAGWGCGVFYPPAYRLVFPFFALIFVTIICLTMWVAILGNSVTAWRLSQGKMNGSDSTKKPPDVIEFIARKWFMSVILFAAMVTFYLLFVVPIENALLSENRILTYWRSMHLTSGVSPIVPLFSIFAGIYASFWFTLHGLALFGRDRPRLPLRKRLQISDVRDKDGMCKDLLRMFSQEDAARKIEGAGRPLNWRLVVITAGLFLLFLMLATTVADGVPVRSLGARRYAIIFLLCLNLCFSLLIAEAGRMYKVWESLRRLLTFLDRLPLRRTMASLHGFSWGNVWKMGGNVLEVRYKVISRQLECMNHSIETLEEYKKVTSDPADVKSAHDCLDALSKMRAAGMEFADWYSINYQESRAGDLTKFCHFQRRVAAACGTILTQLLLPNWRKEKESLILAPSKDNEVADPTIKNVPAQAKDLYIRNAEEFVCLTYMAFIQNMLGRLRTMAMTIMALLLASTIAVSTYPFDPRQALSIILIVLFALVGAVIVYIYAEMHRDATLSHVTNTKPGELGMEFWLKLVGFGFAPLAGLLTRIFPGITDFVFSWLQPGISSLK